MVIFFIFFLLAHAQYQVEVEPDSSCRYERSSEAYDLTKILGHWYSLFDGKTLEHYKCLQLKLDEFMDDEHHHIIQVTHGFALDDKEDSHFYFDDQQLLVFEKRDNNNMAYVHNIGE